MFSCQNAQPAAAPDGLAEARQTVTSQDMRPSADQLAAADAQAFDDGRTRGGMRCPHCRAIANRRTSEPVTPVFWNIYYACADLRCGHTWVAHLSYAHGLSPSAVADPTVTLPMRVVSRDDVVRHPRPEPPGPSGSGNDPNQPRLFGD